MRPAAARRRRGSPRPRRPRRRAASERQGAAQPPRASSPVEPAGVEQQPGQPAGEQRRAESIARPPGQRAQPLLGRSVARPAATVAACTPSMRLAQRRRPRRRRAPARAPAGRRRPGDQRLGDRAERGDVGAADVAVARERASAGSAAIRWADVGVGGGAACQARSTGRQRVGQVGQQARSTRPVTSASVARLVGRSQHRRRGRAGAPSCRTRRRRPARPRTRAPSAAATSPGTCPCCAARRRPARPSAMPSSRSRCSSRTASQVGRLAQVQLDRAARRASRLQPQPPGAAPRGPPPAAPAASPPGTVAEPLADHQPRGDQLEQHVVAVAQHRPVASVTSASPASGRPRSAASVSASRTASMTCALETGRSSSRSTPATVDQPARRRSGRAR